MPSILTKILTLYSLFNTSLLSLVPKKLKKTLPFFSNTPTTNHHRIPQTSPNHRMDVEELQRVFEMFDHNGDGRISKKELNNSLESMGIIIPDAELTQMIEKIDANNDRCVNIDEFGALYQNIMDDRDEEEDMKKAFNVFDQNGDGFVTVDELKTVMASLGLKQGQSAEDCKSMIMKVDVDGDGRVNFNEFKRMLVVLINLCIFLYILYGN